MATGILFSLAWPAIGDLAPLAFIAWVPLLYVEDIIYKFSQRKSYKVFYLSYLAFFVWNLITTWWIYFASPAGMAMAILANSFLMAVVFMLFHLTKRIAGEKAGYASFIIYWLAFEYLHLNWELSWPWLTLGNVFANYTSMIQWYEYTGSLGGSLWILLANMFLFKIIRNQWSKRFSLQGKYGLITLFLLVLIVPIIISVKRRAGYEEKKAPVNIVVVQPNIDPYKDKFGGMTEAQQLNKIFKLAAEETSNSTDYIVCPETALPVGLWENEINHTRSIRDIRMFIKDNPNLKFVTGASTYRFYNNGDKISASARPLSNGEGYYDAYNTALQITNDSIVDIYHKSKLVLGVEKIPFSYFLKPLESFAIDLGGTTGSLGTQKERSVFSSQNDSVKIAPVICYESVYGEYMGGYIRNGAHLIFIITNDGWWDDTPGYKQHLQYARLRAIEARRSIARSANTGISCFINQSGDIIKPTSWWEPATIQHELNANGEMTFYTIHGNYIGRVASWLAAFYILFTTVKALNSSERRLFNINYN